MRRHKRVALVSSIVGALVALVLPLALASPASAAANNTVTVTKVVNGTPTQAGNFEVVVNCGGSIQTLTFAPSGGTQSASFADTQTSCTVQETQSRGADATAIQAVSATAVVNVPNANSAATGATIVFNAGGGQTANVGITNTFNPPAGANTVRVTKAVTGDAPAGAFFQIDVVCGPTQVSLLYTAAGGTRDALIPAGDTNCTVNEVLSSVPVLGVTYSPANAPAGLAPFNPGGNQTKSVTVTNRFASPNPPNTITVEKRFRGTVPANATFTVQVACTVQAGDPGVPVPAPQTHVFTAAGGTHQFQVSKELRNCTVTETNNGGATSVDFQAVVPAASGSLISATNAGVNLVFATGGSRSAQVTITNRFPGDPSNVITINKVTTGSVPADELFLVEVVCTGINFPEQNFVRLLLFGAGQPQTQEVVQPAGNHNGQNECSIRETVSGGAERVVYSATADDPDTLLTVLQPPPGTGFVDVNWPLDVDVDGYEAEVTITNRFADTPLGEDNILRIKKRFRGNIPGTPNAVVRVRCSGGGITEERLITFTDQTPVDLSIPANRNNCVVREIDNGGASSVEYFAVSNTADATDGPNSGRIEFGTSGGESGKVRITNRFPGSCPPGGPKYC